MQFWRWIQLQPRIRNHFKVWSWDVKTLNYKSKLLYPFLATNIPCIMGIWNMHFNIFLLSFCKICDNLWCIGKLDDQVHIDLNEMRTFEIITLNPNQTWNWIYFHNRKPIHSDGHELKKIWITLKGFRI
jgi:hypothetical protein